MTGQYDAGSPGGSDAAVPPPQNRPSRRSVLLGAAGAGIAAATLVGTAAPALAAARGPVAPTARETEIDAQDARMTEPIVVHLRDASAGEIDVFRGTSQVRLRDPELAARIVRASQ